jgi:MFS family permease
MAIMRTTDGPLRHAAFRWYFAGTTVSQLGSSVAPVALAFAVLDLTGSVFDLGLVLAARSLPLVVFLLVGGAVADRFPRAVVFVIANTGAALSQGAVAVLLISGRAEISLLAALAAVNGVLSAFTMPAMRGIVPQLIPPGGRQRANALLGLSRSAAQVLGPAVSGVVVAYAGSGWAVAIDAATFGFAASCALRLPRVSATRSGTRGSTWTDLREGWTTFRGMNWLWISVCSLCVANLLVAGAWGVLGPVVAATTVGAGGWGLALAARAIGLFVSGAVVYRVRISRLLLVGQLCFTTTALPLFALGWYPVLPALLITSLASGLGSGVLSPAWQTLLQDRIPEHQLSRVTAYDDLGATIAIPLGQVLAGPAAGILGAQATAAWAGAVFLLAVLTPLGFRSVREIRAVTH